MKRWMSTIVGGVGLLLGFLSPLRAQEAPAARLEETRRYGIFVGQNDGGTGVHRLLYADSDAKRVREVLERLGGLTPSRVRSLAGADRAQVLSTVARLGEQLEADRRAGFRTTLFFYYSGHADARGLRLGKSRLLMEELKAALRATGADVRVAILDACQSGAAARSKGGSRAPAFLVQADGGDALSGEVFLTSSAADEASQESDRVGGGYFTHHLVTGLLGAADASRDGQVSLEEAYAYAYHLTLFETVGSSVGLQHANIQSELRGHGTLVLTRPSQGQTVLVFPAGLEGQFLVFDRARKRFVAELRLSGQEPQQLSIPAGSYLIQRRAPDHLLTAEVLLTRGTMKQLEPDSMVRSGFEQDFARGVTQANVHRASRAPVRVGVWAGGSSFLFQPEGQPLYPSQVLSGIELALLHRPGEHWSMTFQVGAGQTEEVLTFAYELQTLYRQLQLGLGLRRHWSLGPALGKLPPLELFLGPQLDLWIVTRRLLDGPAEPELSGTTTPGLAAGLELKLPGHLSAGLELRGHSLLYVGEGENLSLIGLSGLFRLSMVF